MNPAWTPFERQLVQALAPERGSENLRRSLLQATGSRRSRKRRMILGLAASLLFTVSGFLITHQGHRASAEGWTQAALSDFLEVRPLDFVPAAAGRDCAEACRSWSAGAVGFPADLPKGLTGQPLRGGRACRIAGQRSVCYLLQDGRAVYVFDGAIQGMDTSRPPVAVARGFQAKAWNEGERGFILVEPPEK